MINELNIKDQPFGTIALLPPPNITGKLHVGHFFCFLLTDIILRADEFCGVNSIWFSGLDHAGIATEYMIKKEFGYVDHQVIKSFEERNIKLLRDELKEFDMGFDWNNFYFTKDPIFSNLSIKVLEKLVLHNFIYIGEYMVNWCTCCNTAISDDEVKHVSKNKILYYVVYEDNNGIKRSIATVRPETILLDEAVCIHTDDQVDFVYLVNPLNKEQLHVYKSSSVDIEFGTSILKLTPNCSKVDKKIAEDLNINFKKTQFVDKHGKCLITGYEGLNMHELQKKVLSKLHIEKTELIQSLVPTCYRCKSEIEYRWSKEIFIKLKEVINKVSIKLNKLNRFFPIEEMYGTIEQWLINVKDWCISRTINNGLKIPICICNENIQVKECTCTNRVFDTWFTSALCMLVAKEVYGQKPNLIVTGKDIIFFWIIRMLAITMFYEEEEEEEEEKEEEACIKTTVLLHGLLRDKNKRKLSKTLQNYDDINNLIRDYGIDYLKLSLILSFNKFEDIKWDITSDAKHINSLKNKLYNINIFLDKMEENNSNTLDEFTQSFIFIANLNINTCIDYVKNTFNIKVAYQLIFNLLQEYSNFYLEIIKREINISKFVLREIFENILAALQIFIPKLLYTGLVGKKSNRIGCISDIYYIKKFIFLIQKDAYISLDNSGKIFTNIYGSFCIQKKVNTLNLNDIDKKILELNEHIERFKLHDIHNNVNRNNMKLLAIHNCKIKEVELAILLIKKDLYSQ